MKIQYSVNTKRHRLVITLTEECDEEDGLLGVITQMIKSRELEGKVVRDPGIMYDEWQWMVLELDIPDPENAREALQAFTTQIRPVVVEHRSRAEKGTVRL